MTRDKKLELLAEMGLNPCALDTLSDDDMLALYAGYRRKMTSLGNLIIVAIREALSDECQPFKMPQRAISREETFKNLGIKEEEQNG